MTDKRRYTLSKTEKEAVQEKCRAVLQEYPYINFAFIHGSFLEDEIPFNDIDIAVHLDEDNLPGTCMDFCLELSMHLSFLVGKKVDVHALNNSGLGFCYEATKGKLLFAKNEDFCFDYIEKIRLKHFDLKPLLEENLKDLLHIS